MTVLKSSFLADGENQEVRFLKMKMIRIRIVTGDFGRVGVPLIDHLYETRRSSTGRGQTLDL